MAPCCPVLIRALFLAVTLTGVSRDLRGVCSGDPQVLHALRLGFSPRLFSCENPRTCLFSPNCILCLSSFSLLQNWKRFPWLDKVSQEQGALWPGGFVTRGLLYCKHPVFSGWPELSLQCLSWGLWSLPQNLHNLCHFQEPFLAQGLHKIIRFWVWALVEPFSEFFAPGWHSGLFTGQ